MTDQQKTAAPTQIDAGELEKAIQYVEGWADSTSKKASPFEAEDLAAFFDVCAAARAHLSKLSGGDAPQSDMVAVPREVVTLAEMAIRDARTMVKLSVSPKNGIMQGGINNLEKAFTALQPYTKGEK